MQHALRVHTPRSFKALREVNPLVSKMSSRDGVRRSGTSGEVRLKKAISDEASACLQTCSYSKSTSSFIGEKTFQIRKLLPWQSNVLQAFRIVGLTA